MIKIIKTNKEYEAALQHAEKLVALDPDAGTEDGDFLELLTLPIEKYENEHFRMKQPDPVSDIKFRMDQSGLAPNLFVPYIGSRSKVSEILNQKRPLSLRMIRSLHKGLGIPAEVLLQENEKTVQPLETSDV